MNVEDACPCGSGRAFQVCCGPFLAASRRPDTAEKLMCSRYSAYVRENISYLHDTLWPKYQAGFDPAHTAQWARENHWTGLAVLKTFAGAAEDRIGEVLFEARFLQNGQLRTHRENSLFKKKAGRWYYVEAVPER